MTILNEFEYLLCHMLNCSMLIEFTMPVIMLCFQEDSGAFFFEGFFLIAGGGFLNFGVKVGASSTSSPSYNIHKQLELAV